MLEVLVMGGMDIFRAMRLLIPPAWQNVEHMDPDLRAFYEYNSMHMEPWDGPAGIVLTDGRYAGLRARPQRPAPGPLRASPRTATSPSPRKSASTTTPRSRS
ncbi:MAG: hypothetical protein MZV65_15070 [Chromatiales bacterium]|nr:hypothetical protein [Chromatiales bacterium]